MWISDSWLRIPKDESANLAITLKPKKNKSSKGIVKMPYFFTREELEAKTDKELKRMCVYELDLPGMTKKRKDVVIDAILAHYGTAAMAAASGADPDEIEIDEPEIEDQFAGTFTSVIDKPDEKPGNRNTTTIRVSSGAAAGDFSVAGRTIGEVRGLLAEVLNIDQMSNGIVNGKNVDDDYVIQENDNVEFMKPAGKKGC